MDEECCRILAALLCLNDSIFHVVGELVEEAFENNFIPFNNFLLTVHVQQAIGGHVSINIYFAGSCSSDVCG